MILSSQTNAAPDLYLQTHRDWTVFQPNKDLQLVQTYEQMVGRMDRWMDGCNVLSPFYMGQQSVHSMVNGKNIQNKI